MAQSLGVPHEQRNNCFTVVFGMVQIRTESQPHMHYASKSCDQWMRISKRQAKQLNCERAKLKEIAKQTKEIALISSFRHFVAKMN